MSRTIPASAELMRLYADYLNREYGALDSDYVFVNLWAAPHGRPLTYSAVYDLVLRLRKRTGIVFEPHQYRHTYATWLLRRGAGMESVKELLGHASITTTIDTYGHLTVEDARRAGGRWLVHRAGGAVVTPDRAPAEASSLLEKLMAVVRPEFRGDVLVPDSGDRVLGGNPCAVPECGRRRREHGFCLVRLRRWHKRGRPEVTGFVADSGPPLQGRVIVKVASW